MDKGKTTKILSGGAYIGKDGKRHEWRKIHGYKPKKITDDNWMEYGMPADEETNESKNMNKKLIRLTESDLHRIVKESVDNLLNEIGDTPKGQYALGRLAYRKGEERPRMGQNVGKMRKDSGNDIFKYADKAAHKNGMYGHEYRNGYDYQDDIDNWDNYSKQEKVTAIISRIMQIRGFNKLVDRNVSIDDMTDEELLDWLKGEQSLYER